MDVWSRKACPRWHDELTEDIIALHAEFEYIPHFRTETAESDGLGTIERICFGRCLKIIKMRILHI